MTKTDSVASLVPDILEAKLTVPRVANLVRRDRLIARLEEGMNGRLTLLCAPAGYGKTTLLVDWLRSRTVNEAPLAAAVWLSLDEGDNDPVLFLRLLIGGLRTAIGEIGEAILKATQGAISAPIQSLLPPLVGEIEAASQELILVFDDYQVIWQAAIHEAVAFLIDFLPQRGHVVIASREDPPFRLAKMRAGGVLCELRAADLRFTHGETASFLHDVMDLTVSAEESGALEASTEGWVAGLKLAALSMRGRDTSPLIDRLDGNHRYIVDYLGAEVLAQQSPPTQAFLLRTSVLDQLCDPLCQAVLGDDGQPSAGAQNMLEHIEHTNLFLVPLDLQRRWYRYHHLFAEFLRMRLHQTDPGLATVLHQRASEWYEQHGLLHEAIRHALAPPDVDRAARLIEQHHLAFFHRGELRTILEWFRALPPAAVRVRPSLSVVHAYALMFTNETEAAERRLQDAEQGLSADRRQGDAGLIRGNILLLRALMIGTSGDIARAIELATEAQDLLPALAVAERALARVIAGYAFEVSGDVTPATQRTVAAAVEEVKAADLPWASRFGLTLLARLYVLQGRLERAAILLADAERALGPHVVMSAPGYCFGLGDVLREQDDFERAEPYLQRGVDAITATNIVAAQMAVRGHIAIARLRQAQGDSQDALAVIDKCIRLARQRNFVPPAIAHAAAGRAHLWLLQGNLAAAFHWEETSGLGPDDEVSFPREPEYLILARVLIARKNRAALPLLDRLLAHAEVCGRLGSVIEIQVLRALAFHALGQPSAALATLERALTIGEPEGYVRVFTDEGAPMATLLRRARSEGIAPAYVARLLQVYDRGPEGAKPSGPEISLPNPAVAVRSEARDRLVEPLTEREREILRLLVTGAPNQAIARRLFITENTVKTHVHHIMAKLDAKNRTEAVAKAKALSLD